MYKDDPKVIDFVEVLKQRKIEKEKEVQQEIDDNYPDLADVAEILVSVSLILDSLGKYEYADKISDVLATMFEDDELK